tara:strand:- start:4616 stop:5098 length:483 start_codon:yes stop_codon:yes gene_type:complete
MTYLELLTKEEILITQWCSHQPNIKLRELTDRYCPYDFTMNYNTSIGLCEAKRRTVSYELYKDEGILIEFEKMSKILSIASEYKDDPKYKNYDFKPFYLTSFTDKTFLFQLDDLSSTEIKIKLLPHYTASDGRIEYIHKPILYLNISDAKLITKTLDFLI